MDRYQRHSLIDWFDQNALRAAHVVVVGAGAVGNEVLKNLALLGVGSAHVIDFDKIELHNLTRCVLFGEADIGRFKAEVATERCRQLDPNMSLAFSTLDLWDCLTFSEVRRAEAVISCVDNFDARIKLNRLCLMGGTDFYNTGIDSRYATVELFPYSTNPDCACYECALPASTYETVQKRYSCGWLRKVAFEERKIPTTTVTSSLAGAVSVSVLLNRLSGHQQSIQTATKYFQDAVSLEATVSRVQRNPDCPRCQETDAGAEHYVVKRQCEPVPQWPLIGQADGEVVLSEPVVTRGVCKLCGRQQEYYQSVRMLTDAITFCALCNTQSVSVEFVERMSVAECERVFAGRQIPCKFLTYSFDNRQSILELEA